MPTIHDVAKLAGVSIATVSRALNNRDNVDNRTRAKVHKAAAQVGYVPRGTAQRPSAALGQGFIAVVTPTEPHTLQDSAIYQRSFSGFHTTASRLGWRIVFHDLSQIIAISPHQLVQEYGGIVFFSCVPPEDEYLAALAEVGLKCIVVNHQHESKDMSWVSVDEEAGTRLAVDRLWNAGRRRFAYVGFREDIPQGAPGWCRYHAAKQILSEKDPDLNLPYLPEAADHVSDLASALKDFLAEHDPDAILVYNDALALPVMSALQTLGVRVGEEVSLIAYDNTYLAELTNPPISCVHIPLETVCSLALVELDARIQAAQANAPLAPSHTLVQPWFVPRKSCGTA